MQNRQRLLAGSYSPCFAFSYRLLLVLRIRTPTVSSLCQRLEASRNRTRVVAPRSTTPLHHFLSSSLLLYHLLPSVSPQDYIARSPPHPCTFSVYPVRSRCRYTSTPARIAIRVPIKKINGQRYHRGNLGSTSILTPSTMPTSPCSQSIGRHDEKSASFSQHPTLSSCSATLNDIYPMAGLNPFLH